MVFWDIHDAGIIIDYSISVANPSFNREVKLVEKITGHIIINNHGEDTDPRRDCLLVSHPACVFDSLGLRAGVFCGGCALSTLNYLFKLHDLSLLQRQPSGHMMCVQ
jgi:hypothetical protein